MCQRCRWRIMACVCTVLQILRSLSANPVSDFFSFWILVSCVLVSRFYFLVSLDSSFPVTPVPSA